MANDKTQPAPTQLRAARERAGMSLNALAQRINADQSTLSKLERGDRKLTKEWAERLAPALDCKPIDLLFAPEEIAEAYLRINRTRPSDSGEGNVIQLHPNHSQEFLTEKAIVLGLLRTRAEGKAAPIDEGALDERATYITHAIMILRGNNPSAPKLQAGADYDSPVRLFKAIEAVTDVNGDP